MPDWPGIVHQQRWVNDVYVINNHLDYIATLINDHLDPVVNDVNHALVYNVNDAVINDHVGPIGPSSWDIDDSAHLDDRDGKCEQRCTGRRCDRWR